MYIVWVNPGDSMGKRFDQWEECAAYIKSMLKKGNEAKVQLYV